MAEQTGAKPRRGCIKTLLLGAGCILGGLAALVLVTIGAGLIYQSWRPYRGWACCVWATSLWVTKA